MQPREWQLHPRFDSGDLNDLEAAGLTNHVPQQSRLPDARLAVYDQDPALSPSDALRQPVQSIEFAGPAAERLRALDGHRTRQRRGAAELNGRTCGREPSTTTAR
jgi:hypothetical protein